MPSSQAGTRCPTRGWRRTPPRSPCARAVNARTDADLERWGHRRLGEQGRQDLRASAKYDPYQARTLELALVDCQDNIRPVFRQLAGGGTRALSNGTPVPARPPNASTMASIEASPRGEARDPDAHDRD